MTKEIMSVMQDKMGKSVAVLKREFGSLRAGRATPPLLYRIPVHYTGTATPSTRWPTSPFPRPGSSPSPLGRAA